MFQHLQNFLRGDTNPKGHSLIHGRQFALLQKMSKNSMIIEGMTTNTGRANILDDLDQLKSKKTIIMITHKKAIIKKYCENIYRVEKGQVNILDE